MTMTTGLSGNELFCLAKKKYMPASLVVGNSVHALGIVRSVSSGFKAIIGGELSQITALIEEGRATAYQRMLHEASLHGASGITGVTSQLIAHENTIEFLSIGSTVRSNSANQAFFSSADNGQELYAQMDVGFQPLCFVFGNVAYSMGVARGVLGSLKTLGRGEIKEYSDLFNHTRHLALNRIIEHAKQYRANAVLGIKTTILPFGGVNEMLMLGTASFHPQLVTDDMNSVVTSAMTNTELWSMVSLGYQPVKLVLGTSVYSLGLVGSITSTLKSFLKGEINELTQMIYEAREQAIGLINEEARMLGAEEVVGVKTYVYQLGNGLVEFLAIGTAVKKSSQLKTDSEQLLVQAIINEKDTFYDSTQASRLAIDINKGTKPINSGYMSFFGLIVFCTAFVLMLLLHGFR